MKSTEPAAPLGATPPAPAGAAASLAAWRARLLSRRPFAGIGRVVVVLGAISLLTDVAGEMIAPLRLLFLVQVLGTPLTLAGLIEGTAEGATSVLRIASGRLADRTAARRGLVLGGYALSNAAKPLLALAASWPTALGLILLDRAGKAVRGSPRDAMLADSVVPARRGKAFGFHRGADTLGAAIGPLLAFAVLAATDGQMRAVFAWTLLPGLAAVLVAVALLREPGAAGGRHSQRVRGGTALAPGPSPSAAGEGGGSRPGAADPAPGAPGAADAGGTAAGAAAPAPAPSRSSRSTSAARGIRRPVGPVGARRIRPSASGGLRGGAPSRVQRRGLNRRPSLPAHTGSHEQHCARTGASPGGITEGVSPGGAPGAGGAADTGGAGMVARALGPRFWLFTAIATCFALGNSSDAFLFLRSEGLEASLLAVPLLYCAFNLAYALLATPLGSLSDRRGRLPVLAAGYAAFTLVYLGWARAGAGWQVWGLFLLYAVYYAATEGVARAFVADLAPSARRGTALGWFGAATGLAALPANVFGAWLWSQWGPGATFGLGAWLGAVSLGLLVAWWPWLRRRPRPWPEDAPPPASRPAPAATH
jgi:MFS family permease